jgi:hypothetical protein
VIVRSVCLVLIALVFDVLSLRGQGIALRNPQPKSQPDSLSDLVTSADSLPVEFRADIELTAIESGKLPESKSAQMLERLLTAADQATYQYPLKPIRMDIRTLESELPLALMMNSVDGLAIRTRVIRATLSRNHAKALREIRELQLHIPPSSCLAGSVPDLTNSYRDLAVLANKAFSLSERNEAAYFSWLEDQIRLMNSVVQGGPLADLVSRVQVPKDERQRLFSLYASSLERLRATDRELAAIENDGTFSVAVRQLAEQMKSGGLSTDPLLDSYQRLLARSSAEIPCGDVTTNWPDIVKRYNSLRNDFRSTDTPKVWDIRELKLPATRNERANLHFQPELADLYQSMTKVYKLRQLNGSPQPREASFDTLAWESDINEFLVRVDAYDPSKAECAECEYFAKAKALLLFFDLTPAGSYKDQVLDRFVQVLATSPVQARWPVLWLFQVKLLLNLSRTPNKDQAQQIETLEKGGKALTMLPSGIGPRIRSAMKNSNNYSMYLYAELEDQLPNAFFSPYLK